MNHTHYQELTSQFIDRELGTEDERDLFAHLGGCDECRMFLKETVRLQSDVAISKFKPVMTNQVVESLRHSPDRPAVIGAAAQVKHARIHTIALLAMIVLAAGLFWSGTLPRQTADRSDLTRQVSVSDLPTYQP